MSVGASHAQWSSSCRFIIDSHRVYKHWRFAANTDHQFAARERTWRRRGGAPGGGTDLNVPFIYLLCSRQAIGRQHMSLLAHATHITAGGASSLSMANSACNRGLVTKRQADCVGSQLMFRWLPVLVRCPHPQFLTNARCSASPEVHWSVTWCWLPMPILRVVYEAQHVELLKAVNSSC